jgi:radical SAM superfamily enzyme YgiQ (UPF0313 family)
MQKTVQNITLSGMPSQPLAKAFQEFVDGLTIPSPKQLILINPMLVPEEMFDPVVARNRGYYAFPPVGLLYLAAVAKQVNPQIDVRVIDLNYELLRRSQFPDFTYQFWQESLRESIESADAPYVGVTYMFGTTKPVVLQVTKWIRDHYPEVPLIMGGVQASYDFQELLQDNYCDVVFRKESELQFRAFLERCFDRTSHIVPWGSAFRLHGQVYPLDDSSETVPVDWDIRPYYDLIDIQNYHKVGSLAAFSRYNGADKSFATVLSNRGCRARCTFCTVRDFNGFGVRQRPIESVVEEIKFLVRQKGIRQIDWLDDDLLWNPQRTIELFKQLASEVPELEWICNNGLISIAITDEIMYWMVQSGLKAFKIGIESGNDKILHEIKKPTTKPKLRMGRELYKKYPEVFVSANFIIGFPNETFGQMMDTFNFANELQWDWSSFYICQPLKGTEMFSAFQALGDDRTEVESYDKTLNPGRSAARGEFGYRFKEGMETVLTGKDVFNLPMDAVPSDDQVKEIWFTFNLVTNFFNNLNFEAGGLPLKIVQWFESIIDAYPYDASMAATLARGYRLLGDQGKATFYQRKLEAILAESVYWQRRVREFPELLKFAETPADGPYMVPV